MLAPLIVRDLVQVSRGWVVEQKRRRRAEFRGPVYVLNNGHVVWDGTPEGLHADPTVMKSHLGVGV